VNDNKNKAAVRPLKKKSQFKDIWRRFKKSRTAMIGLVIILIIILTAIFADVISPAVRIPRPNADDIVIPRAEFTDLTNDRAYPSLQHPFGTDNLGRDIFSRVIHGTRISLQIGTMVVAIASIVGITLGSIAGFYGGLSDNIIMRFIDILLAIPQILLAISISAALGPGLRNVMIAVAISSIPSYARIVRGSVLSLKDQEFIEAAKSVGASNFRLILRHIIPNSMAPLIVNATMGFATAILAAAGLSFIGLGIQPPTPEWGAMLNEGRQIMVQFWPVAVFPGLAIALTVLGFNLLGDGLRDALDPRLKK
jgi:peptide/nickel transport system permease protein